MKNYLKNVGLIVAVSVAGVSSAFAAVPAAVTTALSESVTDVGLIGGGVLIVCIAIAGIGWLRRPMH